MSSPNIPNYRDAIIHGLIMAIILAFLGYALGYGLYLLSTQNLILFESSNVTNPTTSHVVLGQYASSIILPYAFAFLLGIVGLAIGIYKELKS